MNILRKFYYTLTPSLRLVARKVFYFPTDCFDHLLHKRNDMIPPRGMIFIGSGDFVEQGNRLCALTLKHTGLEPAGKILDIGCGIGRLAVPLTRYLNKDGAYYGFDIVKQGIEWCDEHISKKFPNFHFQCVSLKNDLYNLNTEERAKSFTFPYPSNTFDSIVLTSVFTHMMPEDVDNYLQQIALVLKDDGVCFATFFLLNEEVREAMNQNKTHFKFIYEFEGYSLMDKRVKEANIAFDTAFLTQMIDKNGLYIDSTHQGEWSNGTSALDFQDVLILKRK